MDNTTFKGITDEMCALYERKNKDYGNSFDKTCNDLGIVAAAVRIHDKLNRIDSLICKDSREVKDETIEDTFIDLANYSVMSLMWLRKHKQ